MYIIFYNPVISRSVCLEEHFMQRNHFSYMNVHLAYESNPQQQEGELQRRGRGSGEGGKVRYNWFAAAVSITTWDIAVRVRCTLYTLRSRTTTGPIGAHICCKPYKNNWELAAVLQFAAAKVASDNISRSRSNMQQQQQQQRRRTRSRSRSWRRQPQPCG